MISVIWDEDTMKAIVASKGCGCKQDVGCVRFVILGSCNNPLNGGTCARCQPQSDNNATDDEQAPETLPLLSRNGDTVDSATDSDHYNLADADDDTQLCHSTSQMIIVDWPDIRYDAK